MKFHIIIPARLQSTRLPRKMLADINGKPLIQYVYERALLCSAESVTVATDDESIENAVKAFGGSVCRTSVDHLCGTDRLSEAVQKLSLSDEEIIVNLQGDEPLMPVEAVQCVVQAMSLHAEAAMTTACTRVLSEEMLFDPNVPKVVLDNKNFALYFSRAPIPWDRNAFDITKNIYYRHLGIYAYRAALLKAYNHWTPSPLESIEVLEQLRILWYGKRIHVSLLENALPSGIDTAADLEHFRALMRDALS